MIRSMTSFARQDEKLDYGSLGWELRSVNHRYLEIFVRLPEDYRVLEATARELVGKYLDRGKVELNMYFKADQGRADATVFNKDVATQVVNLSQQICQLSPEIKSLRAIDVMKWPGVLEISGPDVDRVKADAVRILETTLKEMVETREREGEKLRMALEERRKSMVDIVTNLRPRIPDILKGVRERLEKRFEEMSVQADEGRLEQEMVFVAQKTDVEEELKRLETHLEEIERLLNPKEYKPVGRRLDFLMQELNREANTLCSKSIDADTTRLGVELKVFIEQMREQIQNIE
ncbi:MAG: YicC family protein [Gammaproteobacteria bacterium]|nr:YicC family protein [Gammaproteobacteria bacterium]